MPPFLMLIAVGFVVLLVMFGHNPMDKVRAEREKYGKDPLAREINKFNEERSKKASGMTKYTPPPGATTYRLPPNQAQILPQKGFNAAGGEELVRPAPDVPMSDWDNPYPAHMMAPRPGFGDTGGNNVILPNNESGATSLVPGAPR